MGTRSLTRIFNKGVEFACIYRQFDGYPCGHGLELAQFINSRPFVNGLSDSQPAFNGIGCFAAQLVAHLKGNEPGGIYLYAPGTKDVWEEFTYEVHGGLDENLSPLPVTVKCIGGEKPFDGSPAEFEDWCKEPSK